MRVDELKPPVRVGWKTISSFRPEWDDTTITFDLRAGGGTTRCSPSRIGVSSKPRKGTQFAPPCLRRKLIHPVVCHNPEFFAVQNDRWAITSHGRRGTTFGILTRCE